jgi:hypothetical protein
MQYLSLLLVLASSSLVSAEPLGRDFTINLLTQVDDMSISIPQLPDQAPIHFKDAAIKHVYKDDKGEAIYSVIGSLTFNETGVPQVYHIDTSQWAVDVSSVITSAE